MDIQAIREKSGDELERLLTEQRVQLEDLRFRMSARELKNVHDIRHVRRTIARILTVLRERASHVSHIAGARV